MYSSGNKPVITRNWFIRPDMVVAFSNSINAIDPYLEIDMEQWTRYPTWALSTKKMKEIADADIHTKDMQFESISIEAVMSPVFLYVAQVVLREKPITEMPEMRVNLEFWFDYLFANMYMSETVHHLHDIRERHLADPDDQLANQLMDSEDHYISLVLLFFAKRIYKIMRNEHFEVNNAFCKKFDFGLRYKDRDLARVRTGKSNWRTTHLSKWRYKDLEIYLPKDGPEGYTGFKFIKPNDHVDLRILDDQMKSALNQHHRMVINQRLNYLPYFSADRMRILQRSLLSQISDYEMWRNNRKQ